MTIIKFYWIFAFITFVISINFSSGQFYEVHNYVPEPYGFGYDIIDGKERQYRHERGNGAGGVVGSYGFKDADGIFRHVKYIADKFGFRAIIKSNEEGLANNKKHPANVQHISRLHPAASNQHDVDDRRNHRIFVGRNLKYYT